MPDKMRPVDHGGIRKKMQERRKEHPWTKEMAENFKKAAEENGKKVRVEEKQGLRKLGKSNI
ncbi:MAG: hypothetical protein NHB14_27195 [Desulfosporosinus sp.]|nr:hypothetical protein [Desulfosporosinus sp.]